MLYLLRYKTGGGICFDSENDTEKKERFSEKYVKRMAHVKMGESLMIRT